MGILLNSQTGINMILIMIYRLKSLNSCKVLILLGFEGFLIFYMLFLSIKKRALNGSVSGFYRSRLRMNLSVFMGYMGIRKRVSNPILLFYGYLVLKRESTCGWNR